MAYNLTELQTTNYASDLIRIANTASSDVLGIGFIISLFIIVVVSLKTENIAEKFAVSSFVCFFPALALSFMGALNIYFALGFLVMAGFASLFLKAT